MFEPWIESTASKNANGHGDIASNTVLNMQERSCLVGEHGVVLQEVFTRVSKDIEEESPKSQNGESSQNSTCALSNFFSVL